jgi:hypothetical protein
MDTKLEVVVLTVSSSDRAEKFYAARGAKR